MNKRQLDMLRAAMPYTNPTLRKPLQVYIQTAELSDYIRSDDSVSEVNACGLDHVGDVEGMMEQIREFCNPRERDMLDMVLHFVRAQKIYQCYRNYKGTAQGSEAGGMMEFLMSQLSPEQRNMFEQMSSVAGN